MSDLLVQTFELTETETAQVILAAMGDGTEEREWTIDDFKPYLDFAQKAKIDSILLGLVLKGRLLMQLMANGEMAFRAAHDVDVMDQEMANGRCF